MVHSPLRYVTLILIAAAMFVSGGCLTTIDDACDTIATQQCSSCFSCAAEVDGVSGAELCDVPSAESTSEANCQEHLTALCEQEARSMEDPYDDLDACEQVSGGASCGELVEREALDQPSAPVECRQFI